LKRFTWVKLVGCDGSGSRDGVAFNEDVGVKVGAVVEDDMALGVEALRANLVDDRRQQQVSVRIVVDLQGLKNNFVILPALVLDGDIQDLRATRLKAGLRVFLVFKSGVLRLVKWD